MCSAQLKSSLIPPSRSPWGAGLHDRASFFLLAHCAVLAWSLTRSDTSRKMAVFLPAWGSWWKPKRSYDFRVFGILTMRASLDSLGQ